MKSDHSFDGATQFLIAEFNALQERAKLLEEIKSGRINFFLLIIAATGAGFSAAAQITVVQQYFFQTILCTAFALFFLGIATLNHSSEYARAIVTLYRGAGRIRRWFYDEYPQISPYLPMEAADNKPSLKLRFKGLIWRGAEPVVIILNSVLTSVIFADIIFYRLNLLLTYSIVISIGSGIVMWFIQMFYVKIKMKKSHERNEKDKEKVRFPYNRDEHLELVEKYLKVQSQEKNEHENQELI